MARQKIPLDAYQTRLAEHFSHEGVVGGHLLPLGRLEQAAGAKLYGTYHGHRYLGDASQSFFVETLGAIERHLAATETYPCPEYPLIYIDVGLVFRRIRSAYVLSTNGYLGPALALLREVKDRSILLSAVLTGRVTYSELMGIDPEKDADLSPGATYDNQRQRRMRLERTVLSESFGKHSGLSEDDIGELAIWSGFFDRETHGSFLSSSAIATDWIKQRRKLQIFSDPEVMDAMFMNRFCEVSWLFHRTIPLLQGPGLEFTDTWRERWRVLEDSFWQMELGLADIGKEIASTFIRFIDTKMAATETSTLVAKKL